MTSAELNKELKRVQSERAALLNQESRTRSYKAAVTENPDDCKTDYDFVETCNRLKELDAQVREIKHRINVFNATHVIPELGMTIDTVLTYLPQLSTRVDTLKGMASQLPKTRVDDRYGRSNLVEYEYTNYDPRVAKAAYDELSAELSKVQLALDWHNNSVEVPQ